MLKLSSLLPLLLLLASTVRAEDTQPSCPTVKVEAELLPRLNSPHALHATLFVNDADLLVVGGHTTGFVPVATAEHFHNGKWATKKTTYDHDAGLVVPLSNGKVLLAGGFAEELGIGLTFSTERLNTKMLHSDASQDREGRLTDSFGCLDTKRAFASALVMDSGKVIISGNWHHTDGIEEYDGKTLFRRVKDVTQSRSLPYILRTAKDNAIIFSSNDNQGHPLDTIIIDRLKGEPFVSSLFDTWKPFYNQVYHDSRYAFIGDETRGIYSYLLPVVNKDGQFAIAHTNGEHISLLPTTCPIPMRSPYGPIRYVTYITVNQQAGKAYMVGVGKDEADARVYIIGVDYLAKPATVTLYYTDPLPEPFYSMPVLTPDGDLIMAGGITRELNNFTPTDAVVRLHVGTPIAAATTSWPTPWLLLPLLLLVLIGAGLWRARRKKPTTTEQTGDIAVTATEGTDNATALDNNTLVERICQLMDEQQLFLRSDLKVSDLATQLGSNSSNISTAIRECHGLTFSQFVNGYRVAYAQHLLRTQPNKKITTVSLESGFANDTHFFRTFKAITGKTPKEWMETTKD